MWSSDGGWSTGADFSAAESGHERDTVMESWANDHGFELSSSLMIEDSAIPAAPKCKKTPARFSKSQIIRYYTIYTMHIPGRGRGVVATTDIPNGTLLFYIPSGEMLTSGTSSFAPQLATVAPGTALAEELGVDLSPYDALILAAAYEAAAAERGESPWTPWLRAVPFDGSVDPPLVSWDDKELAMLEGTAIPRWVRMERAEVAANWAANVAPVVAHFGGSIGLIKTVQDYTRVGAVVRSYTFTNQLGSYDLCFGPIADMLNHVGVGQTAALGVCDRGIDASGSTGGARKSSKGADDKKRRRIDARRGGGKGGRSADATVTSGSNTMAVHSITHIKKGDEIMNHYGELGDVELLHRYGFCEGGKNPFDAVVFPAHETWKVVGRILAATGCPAEEVATRRTNVAEMGLFGDHGPISNGTPGPAVATSPSAPGAIPGGDPQSLLLRMIVRAALIGYSPDTAYTCAWDNEKSGGGGGGGGGGGAGNGEVCDDAELFKLYGLNSSAHSLTKEEEGEALLLPHTEDPHEQMEQMEQFLEAFESTDPALEQQVIIEVLNLRQARLRRALRAATEVTDGSATKPKPKPKQKPKIGKEKKQLARAKRRAELAASVCTAHIAVLDELIAEAGRSA